MKIHFIGDVHGEFYELRKIVQHSRADLLIQIGDLGFFPMLDIYPRYPLNKELLFIDGNHDDIPSLQNEETIEEFLPKNYSYMKRGEFFLHSPAIRIAFLGGGFSIDKDIRTPGMNWFPEEIPTILEIDTFHEAAKDATIIVTHTPPYSFLGKIKTPFKKMDATAMALETVLSDPKVQPKYWICGHMHPETMVTARIMDTQFFCLPCIHELVSSSGQKIPGSHGLILEI